MVFLKGLLYYAAGICSFTAVDFSSHLRNVGKMFYLAPKAMSNPTSTKSEVPIAIAGSLSSKIPPYH